VPNSSAPQSGAIYDGNNVKLADLGLGCFYAGDGLSNALPASQLVPGRPTIWAVAQRLALTLTARLLGPAHVQPRRRPDQQLYNGAPRTNGWALHHRRGTAAHQDYCLRARIYFGAPIPLRPSSSAFNSA
jgi:hypothetical protein